MPEITFNVGGREVTASQLIATAPKRKPKPAAESLKRVDAREHAKESDGFAVLGYSPAHWAQRETDYTAAMLSFKTGGGKNPGTAEEFTTRWMQKNKPKRARTKPYEIESAADQCAELMRKAGWLHVRVEELMKG
jgi:hypothetical protein